MTQDTKDVTASNGTWSGNPVLDTSVPENFTYQWYSCIFGLSRAPADDPTGIMTRKGPLCEEISGAVSKVYTVGLELCGRYLLVGVVADNTDFRNKGGASDMRWGPTSSSPVGGTACP